MFQTIIAFLIIPFAPFWFYGDMANNFQQGSDSIGEVCHREGCNLVKSQEETSFDANKLEKHSFFPIDSVLAAGLIPTRKADVPDLKVWAGSSVAIDVDTGTIIHYDDGRKRTQIASLTKMMTAILVIESIKDLNEEVVISKEAVNMVGTVVGCPTSVFCNGNRMYVGEKVRAIDLLKATLMNSANDAATALAIHIGGTPENFVEMMNKKATNMGLKDTNFCTPSGLEIDGKEEQCFSTAYDIARIAAYSLKYDIIWEIMKIPDGKFYSTDGKYMHDLKNTDILLDTLPNCIGGKTGFTPLAGKSLLLGAEDPAGKHKIIAVILNDNQRWESMKMLVDWIFTNYKWQ